MINKRVLALFMAAAIGISAFAACDDTEGEIGGNREKDTEIKADTDQDSQSLDSETADEYLTEAASEEYTEAHTESVDPTEIFDTFYGVDYFSSEVDISNTKKVVGKDGDTKFVRYARTAEFQDGFYVFANAEKTKTYGRYLVMKYRTDHMSSGEIWANTNEASHGNGMAYCLQNYRADGNWHIMILDLESAMPATVSSGGKHMLKYFRIDLLNNKASRGYMDVAYVALCNDISKANEYVTDSEQSICDHYFVSSADRALCAVCGFSTEQGDGSTGLKYTIEDGGVCFVSGIGSCTDTDIVIPSKSPSGQKVVRIGGGAFAGQSNIRSVTIPKSVTMICSTAFDGCTSLESVNIPDSVTFIGCEAFAHCTSLKNIVIPDSVTDIQGGVFWGCSSLQSITVPFVGYPGEEEYCGRLVDFFGFEEDIPNSLRSVTVTKTVDIADDAFSGFKYLTSITLCEGVETVGEYAFLNCRNLYTVSIPESIRRIGSTAFEGCERLKYNEYEGGDYLGNSDNPYVAIMDGRDAKIIHPSAKYIGYAAFRTTYIKSIVIPEGVRYIEAEAFDGGVYLSSVTLPNSLISIGNGAFNGCSELCEVVFGDSPKLKNIENRAFRYCSSLEEFTVPESVEFIGPNAFQSCSSLKKIYFEEVNGWWTSPYEVGAPYFDEELIKDIDSVILDKKAAELLISSSAYWYKRK